MDSASDKNINALKTEAKNFIKAYKADIEKVSTLLKKTAASRDGFGGGGCVAVCAAASRRRAL